MYLQYFLELYYHLVHIYLLNGLKLKKLFIIGQLAY